MGILKEDPEQLISYFLGTPERHILEDILEKYGIRHCVVTIPREGWMSLAIPNKKSLADVIRKFRKAEHPMEFILTDKNSLFIYLVWSSEEVEIQEIINFIEKCI